MVVLTMKFLAHFFFPPNGIDAYTDGRNIYLFMGGLGFTKSNRLIGSSYFISWYS